MSLTSYRAAPPRAKPTGAAQETPNPPRTRRAGQSGRRTGREKEGFSYEVSGPSRAGSDLLSHALRRSTIDPGGLNDRVRDGIGWGTPGIATSSTRAARFKHDIVLFGSKDPMHNAPVQATVSSPCMNVTSIKPNELLVPVSSTPRSASTPGLSTSWSRTALQGNLVLRGVSRLDAFSVYPVRT